MGSFGLNYKLTNASNPLGEMEGTGANLTEGLKGWFLVRLWFCHRRRMVKPSHSFGVPQETHHHFRISLQVWGHAFHGFETVQPQMLDLVSHAHAASTKALLNCIGGEEKKCRQRTTAMRDMLPLLPSGPGGVRSPAIHGP